MEDCSTSGATIRISPNLEATRASAAIPGLKIPSSLQMRMRNFIPLTETFLREPLAESACEYAQFHLPVRDSSMRIVLLHNPKAGNGEHEAEELIEALQKAGHEADYQSSKKKGIKKALQRQIDLVLAAGGDGAVGKVARRLIGSRIPLSVLPLGTANNLARMLGFAGPANKVIERLSAGKRRGFDVGLARGPWGTRYFFEGAGAGLFADYLQEPRKENKKTESISKAEEMKRHVVELRRQLQDFPARQWKIELDDEAFSGRYLLWQAMNIRSIGPDLRWAPRAKTNDGPP